MTDTVEFTVTGDDWAALHRAAKQRLVAYLPPNVDVTMDDYELEAEAHLDGTWGALVRCNVYALTPRGYTVVAT